VKAITPEIPSSITIKTPPTTVATLVHGKSRSSAFPVADLQPNMDWFSVPCTMVQEQDPLYPLTFANPFSLPTLEHTFNYDFSTPSWTNVLHEHHDFFPDLSMETYNEPAEAFSSWITTGTHGDSANGHSVVHSIHAPRMQWSLLSFLEGMGKAVLPAIQNFIGDTTRPLNIQNLIQAMSTPADSRSLAKYGPDLQTVYIVISALANNLVRLENLTNPENAMDELIRKVILHFNGLESRRFIQILESFPEPFRSSLQSGIFGAAIEIGADRIVDIILDRGVDPDEVKLLISGQDQSPLARSCLRGWVHITRALLAKNADPNKSNDLMWGLLDIDRLKPDIVTLLLQNGLEFHDPFHGKMFASDTTNPRTCFILAEHISSRSQSLLYNLEYLRAVLNQTDSHLAYLTVEMMFRRDWDKKIRESKGFQDALTNGLNMAIEHHHMEAYKILLEQGAKPDCDTLSSAIIARNVAIVRDVLILGISAYEKGYEQGRNLAPSGRPSKRRIAIAEAFRTDSPEIIGLILPHGLIAGLDGHYEVIIESILVACEIGKETLLDELLPLWERCPPPTFSSSVNGSQINGSFSIAIENGHEFMVAKLLESEILPGVGALEAALTHRKFDLVDMMLEPALGSIRQNNLAQAEILHCAVRAECLKTVLALLASGIKADITIRSLKPHWMEWRFDHSAPFKKEGFYPALTTAILSGNREVIDLFLKLGAHHSEISSYLDDEYARRIRKEPDISPLFAAVHTNNFGLVTELIARGVDPSDNKALLEASLTGNVLLTQVLLDAIQPWRLGRSKIGFGAESLQAAINKEDLLMLNILVPFTDVNYPSGKSSLTAMGFAIKSSSSKSIQMIDVLLRHGANVNGVAENYYRSHTPLNLAISTGNIDTIKVLVAAGADIHAPPIHGVRHTPLQAAVYMGSLEIVNYFLELGVDINALPALREGGTALQIAAKRGYMGMAALLIEKKAFVNAPRGQFIGRTAFEAAAEKGRIEMLMFLVEHGADIVSDGGKQYERACRFAKMNGHLGVVAFVEGVYAEQCANMAAMMAPLEFNNFDTTAIS
jgi:ankyrin repeat protein